MRNLKSRKLWNRLMPTPARMACRGRRNSSWPLGRCFAAAKLRSSGLEQIRRKTPLSPAGEAVASIRDGNFWSSRTHHALDLMGHTGKKCLNPIPARRRTLP